MVWVLHLDLVQEAVNDVGPLTGRWFPSDKTDYQEHICMVAAAVNDIIHITDSFVLLLL